MYPNLYSKRKCYGNHFNSYLMMPAPMLPMAINQKLHPSAPPFEPKRNLHMEYQEKNEIELNENEVVDTQENNDMVSTTNTMNTNTMNTNTMNANTMNTNTMNTNTMNITPVSPKSDAMADQSVPTPKVTQPQPLLPYPGEHVVAGYHPLQHVWTMWYLETDRSKTWEEMQNEISSIDNVEDFWRLYNHIKPASELKTGCDYSLFKRGIRPMWEDDANRSGGRWIMNLPRSVTKVELDSLWLDVLLCLIGETFEQSDQLCGAVVNVRSKNNKISVWTTDGENSKAILEIGYKLRDILRLVPYQLHYQLHRDTIAKTGSVVKSTYTI